MNRNNTTVMRKERRRDRRRALESEAYLDGREVKLIDISASGFGAVLDATDRSSMDFRIGRSALLELKSQNGETVAIPVEIVRAAAEQGLVGGVFTELSNDAYNFVEGLLTGRAQRRR